MTHTPPAPSAGSYRPTFLPEESEAAWSDRQEWGERGRLAHAWQVPAFVAAALLLAAVTAYLFPRGGPLPTPQELLHRMEIGLRRGEFEAVEEVGKLFLKEYPEPTVERALAHLDYGYALWERARREDLPDPALLERAAEQFAAARQLPLPPERLAEAWLMEGKCLARLGRTDEADSHYRAGLAVEGGETLIKTRLHLALLRTETGKPHPDLGRIDRHLALILLDRRLPPEERAEALALAAEAALRLENWQRAETWFGKVLEEFPETSAAGTARLGLAKVAYRKGDYPSARRAAEDFLSSRSPIRVESTGIIAAAFILADSLLQTGHLDEALTAFRQLRRDFPLSPEGRAAGLGEVDCLVRKGRGTEALEILRQVAPTISEIAGGGFPYPNLNPAGVVDRLRRFFFSRGQYERAAELAEAARTLIGQRAYLETRANALKLLAEQEERATTNQQDEHAQLARSAYLRAGNAFMQLAQATRTEGTYIEHLWSAVECYRRSASYPHLVRALETFIENRFGAVTDPEAERYAQAAYYLGQAYAALGRPEDAIERFRDLVRRLPRNPYSYLARLEWARCCLNTGHLEEAERVLLTVVENRDGDLFTPRSMVWRRALFLLGEVLARKGNYPEAVRRLSEAIERYPDDPETLHSRYLLAGCYRSWAQQLLEDDQADTSDLDERAEIRRQRRRLLAKAIVHYRALLERYRTRKSPLQPLEQLERSNSAFFLADCYFELGRYREALSAYEEAVFHYSDDPRSLTALLRMAEVWRRQGKPRKAEAVLNRARLLLQHLEAHRFRRHPAGLDRREWTAWLNWASKRL